MRLLEIIESFCQKYYINKIVLKAAKLYMENISRELYLLKSYLIFFLENRMFGRPVSCSVITIIKRDMSTRCEYCDRTMGIFTESCGNQETGGINKTNSSQSLYCKF